MQFEKPQSKSDTSQGIHDALASKRPTVPEHLELREQDRIYFDNIIDSRAYDTWYASDVENAVTLAKAKADCDALQHILDVEGYVYEAPSGQLKPHPAEAILDRKIKQVAALSRALHVHATALLGRAEDTGNRTAAHRQHREAFDDGDDLLARPESD
ncbi:TerS protein [Salinisphaera sp. LB1]|uniref:TerS protein n=1 Tax=Salinisphaera sp. LB1 TaxID=2183911 RepID=UPI000D708BE9|nr:TerS protein [Salinisphaera sp. LB1]